VPILALTSALTELHQVHYFALVHNFALV
jgi:hypothetical protein